jgi:hypothetical protein
MRFIKPIPTFFILITLSLTLSCQTFGLKKSVPKPIGSFQAIDTGRYIVTADLISSEKSKKYFGVNLTELDVLAINIGIENKSTAPLRLTLDDIFIRDQDKYLYRPMPMKKLARRIYKANKYKEMVNYGAKKGAIYGVSGAVIGAVTGVIVGGNPGTGAAVGGWTLGSVKAVEGAEEAKGKATERIKEDLGTLILVPGRIPYDTKVRGVLFFDIPLEDIKDIEFLGVRLEEQDTKEKLNLDLQIFRQAD